MEPAARSYPVQLSVDYPERPLSRRSTLFRVPLLIPAWVLLSLLTGQGIGSSEGDGGYEATAAVSMSLAVAALLLFRQKYPRWIFDFNLEIARFSNRAVAYTLLLTDRYPSSDDAQAVHLDIAYPNASELSRGLPLIKWVLAIPHLIVLAVLTVGSLLAVVLAWVAILFSGSYPRPLFDLVEGTMRWWARVEGYALLMVTDEYPPFRLGP
ncbi:MAG: DUF4389 domain-containing protein [Chloroflexi bacterium]|nr:DUF4389 domain-containing protein [Chloroflexota bacterium]